MADVTTRLLASVLTAIKDVYAFWMNLNFVTLASGDASSGDRIQLVTITQACRCYQAFLDVSGTLGAGCTLKLQRDRAGVYTDFTVATTAAGASHVSGITILPLDLAVGDVISLLVGGANIAAAATVNVDLNLQTK